MSEPVEIVTFAIASCTTVQNPAADNCHFAPDVPIPMSADLARSGRRVGFARVSTFPA